MTPVPVASSPTAAAATLLTGGPAGAEINHLRALFQQTPASLTGNLIGVLLISAIYGSLADTSLLYTSRCV